MLELHSVGYYNSALYFNVNNKIFKYDLGSDKITEVKRIQYSFRTAG